MGEHTEITERRLDWRDYVRDRRMPRRLKKRLKRTVIQIEWTFYSSRPTPPESP